MTDEYNVLLVNWLIARATGGYEIWQKNRWL